MIRRLLFAHLKDDENSGLFLKYADGGYWVRLYYEEKTHLFRNNETGEVGKSGETRKLVSKVSSSFENIEAVDDALAEFGLSWDKLKVIVPRDRLRSTLLYKIL